MEKMTFKEWADIWLAEKKESVKANTFKTTYQDMFRLHLIPEFGAVPIDGMTKRDFAEYIKSLSTRYSNSVLSKIRLCVLSMYSAAIERDLCTVNPAIGVKVKSLVEKKHKCVYSPQEAALLYDYAKEHRYGLGICIMLETGVRCSEMLGLKWQDVDFRARCLYVNRASVTVDYKALVSLPKSENSVRILPISSKLCETLQKAFAVRTSEYIVPRPSGDPYHPVDYLRYRYNPFMKEATDALGLPRLTSHELRHTRGTNLYSSSGDIYAVSKYLGHSSVDTTAKYYIHSSPEVLRCRLGI